MSKARRWRRLDPVERHIALEAVLLVGVVRLALSVLSLRAVRSLLVRLPVAARCGGDLDDIARAIARAAAVIPRATCLVQSLAGLALLERHGHPARLRLGFAGGAGRALAGHAWVESGGRIVVGGGDPARYAPAPDLVWDAR
jgi:hypothetical protein